MADNSVLAGSANISKNSAKLDEAAILTTEPAAVRRARDFIDRLCSEPVSPRYLEECKKLYRPPHFTNAPGPNRHGPPPTTHAKLWIVNLRDYSVPDSEIRRYRKGEKKAKKLVADTLHYEMDNFHWPNKPRMATELEFGDWVIQVLRRKDKTILVYPPGRFILLDRYTRDSKSGKERYVFHLEVPRRGQTIPWPRFRQTANRLLHRASKAPPRTMPVPEIEAADRFLTMWTPRGRVATR